MLIEVPIEAPKPGEKITKKDNCYFPNLWEDGDVRGSSLPFSLLPMVYHVMLFSTADVRRIYCTVHGSLSYFSLSNQFKVSYTHPYPNLYLFPHRLFEVCMVQCFPKTFSHLDNYMQK